MRLSRATFTGGLTGSWSFTYNGGAPDLFLQSITLDLSPTDLTFDTAPSGYLAYQDIGGFGGTDGTTGLSPTYLSGAALNGGNEVTFSFADFLPTGTFQFSADVVRPYPVLLTLQDCAGKTGLALIACNAANATRTATNNARLLAAQTVGPNQMAGAVVTFTFGGANYNTTPVQGVFQRVTLRDIILGLAQGEGAVVFNSNAGTNADVTTPEPACVATFGAGLGLLLVLAVRRRRA
jgi:hypothetical protein